MKVDKIEMCNVVAPSKEIRTCPRTYVSTPSQFVLPLALVPVLHLSLLSAPDQVQLPSACKMMGQVRRCGFPRARQNLGRAVYSSLEAWKATSTYQPTSREH